MSCVRVNFGVQRAEKGLGDCFLRQFDLLAHDDGRWLFDWNLFFDCVDADVFDELKAFCVHFGASQEVVTAQRSFGGSIKRFS